MQECLKFHKSAVLLSQASRLLLYLGCTSHDYPFTLAVTPARLPGHPRDYPVTLAQLPGYPRNYADGCSSGAGPSPGKNLRLIKMAMSMMACETMAAISPE